VKFQGLVHLLAIAGSFGSTFACGKVVDEIGNDGGRDSSGDVFAVDSHSGSNSGDDEIYATPDSSVDVLTPDVVAEVPPCPDAGDSGVPSPSCAPGGDGMTNCGSCNESCCTSPEIEGGTYDRTYTYGDTSSYANPAMVSGFRLDKYLVTVGRFRQFVAAWSNGAGYLPSSGAGKHTHLNAGLGLENSGSPGTYETGWDATDDSYIDPTDANLACQAPSNTWTNTSGGGQENLPINCVTWQEAYAFCIWDGGFLPSEAEWEYAAAGGRQQRQYPWGSTDPGTNNQYAIYGCDYPSAAGICDAPGVGNIAPVGTASRGVGLWGQLDLVGEVWEWNLDWYASYENPCSDCAYLKYSKASLGRVYRGGIYGDVPIFLLPPTRSAHPPTLRNSGFGFRCAKTP
jgi:formylglycine-generating enzyme required for sulfatase activity